MCGRWGKLVLMPNLFQPYLLETTNMTCQYIYIPHTHIYIYIMYVICIIIKGKMWVPLGEYPSSRSQNITPYCPIQPLYNPYIGGICGYISRVLSQGYPTFPFEIIVSVLIFLLPWHGHHDFWCFTLDSFQGECTIVVEVCQGQLSGEMVAVVFFC